MPCDPRLEEATRDFETDFSIRTDTANGFDPGCEVPISHLLPQQWQRRRPECLHARPPLVQTVAPFDGPGRAEAIHSWGELSNLPPPHHFSPRSTTSCTTSARCVVFPPPRGSQREHPTNSIRDEIVETKTERRWFYSRRRFMSRKFRRDSRARSVSARTRARETRECAHATRWHRKKIVIDAIGTL